MFIQNFGLIHCSFGCYTPFWWQPVDLYLLSFTFQNFTENWLKLFFMKALKISSCTFTGKFNTWYLIWIILRYYDCTIRDISQWITKNPNLRHIFNFTYIERISVLCNVKFMVNLWSNCFKLSKIDILLTNYEPIKYTKMDSLPCHALITLI